MSELTRSRSDPLLLLSRRHLYLHTDQTCRTSRRLTLTYGPWPASSWRRAARPRGRPVSWPSSSTLCWPPSRPSPRPCARPAWLTCKYRVLGGRSFTVEQHVRVKVSETTSESLSLWNPGSVWNHKGLQQLQQTSEHTPHLGFGCASIQSTCAWKYDIWALWRRRAAWSTVFKFTNQTAHLKCILDFCRFLETLHIVCPTMFSVLHLLFIRQDRCIY